MKEKLKGLIKQLFNIYDNIEITDSTDLIDDLELDSLELVELVVEIESQLDISLEDDDLDIEKIRKFNKLYEIVNKKLKLISE